MTKLIGSDAAFRRDPWLGHGLALAAFLVALGLRHQLASVLPPGYPYITFFPAVILTGFLAGLRPGLVCAALSGLASWYYFLPPANSFVLDGPAAIALAFYVFVAGVDLALIHVMQRSTDRLAAEREALAREREVTAGLYEQQRTMFQELQHRVANNMAFVASLLHLQRRKVVADPTTAAEALDEAGRRIEVMSRIHRRLYDPAAVEMPLGEYFQEVARDLLDATGAHSIVVLVDMPAIKLDVARLMVLSLLATEVVTNSLKHAFEDRGEGTITLRLERLDSDRLSFTIRDDGRGFTVDRASVPARSAGLGTRICQGLAAQLAGELTVTSEPGRGTTTSLAFIG
ncbi:sensor histidine kinase [Sphingomonas lenta]|uniref:histidine kinase n=1 Tax=Sphingomonas lenta TaxID=1141887 RepID=A0A2A2SHR2_9SPHN|nr:histidine kinase dimerization/phosphoacceptor domain -containing protein [Sphingomonas lenta]PAX08824.1 ATPase [Sphingomonas lenta]